MSRSLQRRLDALAKKIFTGEPNVRFVFKEDGDTDEDVEAKKRDLIARGFATPYDRIITFCWQSKKGEAAGN
jgi:hypothetical protein